MFGFLNPFLDTIFAPLLKLGIFWTVLTISFLLSVLITVVYKYTTDQNLMKQLKTEIKELQKEAKTLQENPEQFKKVQKQMMQTNMKVMSESFKPMIYYFIPIIIIFGWMNANLYYEPLMPGQNFSIDVFNNNVNLTNYEGLNFLEQKTVAFNGEEAQRFKFNGNAGEYLINFNVNEKIISKNVLINEQKYNSPTETIENIKIITNNKLITLFNLGFMEIGWLGTYIISSIIFSSLLRKWMNVY